MRGKGKGPSSENLALPAAQYIGLYATQSQGDKNQNWTSPLDTPSQIPPRGNYASGRTNSQDPLEKESRSSISKKGLESADLVRAGKERPARERP